jgi:hypothetical protein
MKIKDLYLYAIPNPFIKTEHCQETGFNDERIEFLIGDSRKLFLLGI